MRPEAQTRTLSRRWDGAAGLAEDVRYYGQWLRTEAARRISQIYPPTADGRSLQAWLWARTIPCPNPACGMTVPLVSSWDLCARPATRAWIEPLPDREACTMRYAIRTGKGAAPAPTVNRRGAQCPSCGQPIPFDYMRAVGGAGGLGMDLIAMVAAGDEGPRYLPPDPDQAASALTTSAPDLLDTPLPDQALGFRVRESGLRRHRDLFAPRQLVLLDTLSDLVHAAHDRALEDAGRRGSPLTRCHSRMEDRVRAPTPMRSPPTWPWPSIS